MRSFSYLKALVLFGPALLGAAVGDFPGSRSVFSPDGRNAFRITIRERLHPHPPGDRLYFSVLRDGREILLDSPFGLDFKDHEPLGRDLEIVGESRTIVDETWETVAGKNRRVRNFYNEIRISMREKAESGRLLEWIVRAYDEGLAFRYHLPEQESLQKFRLAAERSEFHFAENHACWAARFGGFRSHQESEYEKTKIGSLSVSEPAGLPLLIQVGDTCWLALAEAGLSDWAGMYLASAGTAANALVTALSPRLDEPGVVVRSGTPRLSPWRVLMVSDAPCGLVESDLILNLNEPCAIGDVSWIRPGKSAWDRWWSGSYAPDADFEVGMNTATLKYYTDFAAEMGWEYVLVDWFWYGNPFQGDFQPVKDADITKPVPELDLQELIRYAKSKKVGVWLWLEWSHADRQMDEAFALYEKWGISGVKIDFMARDDQDMVRFYERTLKKAAEHRLLVDFHGAYKPTGLSRTFPNFITQEGVLGNEYNKWSSRVTPEHNVTLPFTRMLAGPMDYTPGGFRNATRDQFRVVGGDAPAPFVMGTRCHQLAMLVVYESPFQVLCDSPYNYRRSLQGLDFLKIVPAAWDEIRCLSGRVGEFVVIARRSGKDWFIGAMTGWDSRNLEIPLFFLDRGTYEARIWSDAPDSDVYPDRLARENRTVKRNEKISLRLASGGGSVIQLTPKQ
ncbi:glycoside hydrolase family 97 protein [bacterium]|nr:glycoside hydrolase family 97 protein [bacterium]